MRILAISPYYPPHNIGGHEIRCRNILDGLIKLGNEVEIITNRCDDNKCLLHTNESGIHRLLHLTNDQSCTFQSIFYDYIDISVIKNMYFDFKPDFVYLFGIQNLALSILPFFARLDIPLIFDEGGSNLAFLTRKYKNGLYFHHKIKQGFFKDTIKKYLLSFVRGMTGGLIDSNWNWPANMQIIYNSQSALEFSHENGVDTSKAVVLQPGIDTKLFSFKPRKVFNETVIILLAGRIKPVKGTVDGLHLLKNLLMIGIKAKLNIVGDAEDRKYLQELVRITRELGIEEYVNIASRVDQASLANYYAASDICFFPTSYKSGFSQTTLEAMACGAIVISYGNEGSKGVIESGENGFIIPEGDIAFACEVIKELITTPGLVESITKNSRKLIESEYSMSNYISRVAHFLTTNRMNKNKLEIS